MSLKSQYYGDRNRPYPILLKKKNVIKPVIYNSEFMVSHAHNFNTGNNMPITSISPPEKPRSPSFRHLNPTKLCFPLLLPLILCFYLLCNKSHYGGRNEP